MILCSRFKLTVTDALLILLLVSMLMAQTSYMLFKLALILLISLLNFFNGQYRIERFNPVILGILFLIILSGVYKLVSAIFCGTMDNLTLMTKVPFLLIHPLLYYLLLPNMMGYNNHRKICYIIVLGHFLILFFSYYNLYAVFNGLPPLQLAEEEESFIASEDSIGISSGVVYQAMITAPIFFTLGFTNKINPYIFAGGFFLTIIFSVLSTRVTLMIIIFLCLLIPIFLQRLLPLSNFYWKKWKKGVVVSLGVGLCFFPILIQTPIIESIRNDVMEHFDSKEDIRFEQREILLDNWMESPIFGKGYGALFKTRGKGGYQAEFESTYHLELATTGIIGFALFSLYMFLIIKNLYLRAYLQNNPFAMAAVFALISMLIASFTNPALSSFDRLLPIYMCIGFFADRNNKFSDYEVRQ